jgi:hypothetical protein
MPKTEIVKFRLTPEEKSQLLEDAGTQTLSDYIRFKLGIDSGAVRAVSKPAAVKVKQVDVIDVHPDAITNPVMKVQPAPNPPESAYERLLREQGKNA